MASSRQFTVNIITEVGSGWGTEYQNFRANSGSS